jgi:hypothetical protein
VAQFFKNPGGCKQLHPSSRPGLRVHGAGNLFR